MFCFRSLCLKIDQCGKEHIRKPDNNLIIGHQIRFLLPKLILNSNSAFSMRVIHGNEFSFQTRNILDLNMRIRSNVCFLDSDNGISQIFSISFNFSQTIFFAEYGA